MRETDRAAAILNSGPLDWAFSDFAPRSGRSFIPFHAIQIAGDKRLMAERFIAHDIPIPESRSIATWAEAMDVVRASPTKSWVLKYPTASGACGHVDRDVGDDALAYELDRRFAIAFWRWLGAAPPWGDGAYHPRP